DRSTAPNWRAAYARWPRAVPTSHPSPPRERASPRGRPARWPSDRAAVPSTAVTAVDVDVTVREVAGIGAGGTLPEPDIDADRDLVVLHVSACRRLVVGRRPFTVPCDLEIPERD